MVNQNIKDAEGCFYNAEREIIPESGQFHMSQALYFQNKEIIELLNLIKEKKE